MIVVSDTSPILNLARIGRLELLTLLVRASPHPRAVSAELAANTNAAPVITIATSSWLIIAIPKDQNRVEELLHTLDAGEAEAIVLAVERHAELLLVDERRGRRTAEAAGLRITRLLGVLAQAKRAGLIESVKPILDDSIGHARFWIGPDLYNEVSCGVG